MDIYPYSAQHLPSGFFPFVLFILLGTAPTKINDRYIIPQMEIPVNPLLHCLVQKGPGG